jgi:hypothetical protein
MILIWTNHLFMGGDIIDGIRTITGIIHHVRSYFQKPRWEYAAAHLQLCPLHTLPARHLHGSHLVLLWDTLPCLVHRHVGHAHGDHMSCVHLGAAGTGHTSRFQPRARPRHTGPLGLVACHVPQAADPGKLRSWAKIGLTLFLCFCFFRKPLFV